MGQEAIAEAPASFVITGVFSRTTARYGSRGERYVYMEAGHVGQNIHLQAIALGLDSVPIGAFSDAAVHRVLGLPKAQQPLYVIPVGYKR